MRFSFGFIQNMANNFPFYLAALIVDVDGDENPTIVEVKEGCLRRDVTGNRRSALGHCNWSAWKNQQVLKAKQMQKWQPINVEQLEI